MRSDSLLCYCYAPCQSNKCCRGDDHRTVMITELVPWQQSSETAAFQIAENVCEDARQFQLDLLEWTAAPTRST